MRSLIDDFVDETAIVILQLQTRYVCVCVCVCVCPTIADCVTDSTL